MKGKIKTGIIIDLIILLGIAAYFGNKAINKYTKDISDLKYANTGLNLQIANRDLLIKVEQEKTAKKDKTIDSLMVLFKTRDQQVVVLTEQRDSALAHLQGITSDSSYRFLIAIAYPFKGDLKYLFNALQIHGIHTDYLIARSSEKTIPIYKEEISNCKIQFTQRDSLEVGLKKIIRLQKQNLTDCQQINKNDDTIIKDTISALKKETRRKNFWKVTTIVTTVTTLLGIFGVL
jgi:hypothetical protein